jgi:hypothetical protein
MDHHPQSTVVVPLLFTLLCGWACVSIFRAHQIDEHDVIAKRARERCAADKRCQSVTTTPMPGEGFRDSGRRVIVQSNREWTHDERVAFLRTIVAPPTGIETKLRVVTPSDSQAAAGPSKGQPPKGGAR